VTPDPPPDPGARWTRIKELFQQALEQPVAQRRTWLASAAGADADLFNDVASLLIAHEKDGSFLQEPPAVAPPAPKVFPPGTRLGPYEIVDELGRGGAGIVYLALDHRLERQVALKLVAAHANADLRDRLRREARAAATIGHPSVATIHALEEFDDQLFIVSEYVRGRTLRAELANGQMPRARVMTIARELAHALRAAHAVGVVHRDLKPENVLLSDTGAVKVVDFGIARMANRELTQLTRHGALLGTPAYMAPEQLLGSEVDARADIYAFGVVLIEMLTGRHPGGATATATAPADEGLTAIARQCTELDRTARIQSAALLVSALDRLDRRSGTHRSSSRWWWEFHQAVVATVYGLTLFPAWHARSVLGGSLGRAFFIVILAAVVVSGCLRLHLWFTSRFYSAELMWVRRRSSGWIAAGDVLFSVGLVSAAVLSRAENSSVDVLLLSVGVGAAVAFLAIEPTTTRAAFRRDD
jgi:hypothetical protein